MKISLLVALSALAGCGGGGGSSDADGGPADAGLVAGSLTIDYQGRFSAHAWGDFAQDGSTVLIFHGPTVSTVEAQIPFKAIRIEESGAIIDISDRLFESRPTATEARRALALDLDGDELLDFFCANQGLDSAPWPGEHQTVMYGQPGGTLRDESEMLPDLVNFGHSAAAADLRHQGTLDILVGAYDWTYNADLADEYRGPNVSNDDKVGPWMLRNDGMGNLTYDNVSLPAKVAAPYLGNGGSPGVFATSRFADLDNDGYADLILGAQQYSEAGGAVYLNDQSGAFDQTEEHVLPTGRFGALNTSSVDTWTTDLDGDGLLDVLFLQVPTDYLGSRIQVLMNQGGGEFTDETDTRFPDQASGPYWGMWFYELDFDEDGDNDLFIVKDFYYPSEPGAGPDDHLLFLNDGAGNFSAAPDEMVPPRSEWRQLLPVDFDKDGHVDLIGFQYDFTSMTIRTYRNGSW